MGKVSTATVRLELESHPESAAVVRAMLAGAGRHLSLARERLDDLRTAVSEACNNVVLHAYADGPGPLAIDLELDPGEIRVKVRDRGSGVRSIISAQPRMRVGLALISALADRAEVRSPPDGGTEVRMVFTQTAERAGSDPEWLLEHRVPDLAPLGGSIVAYVAPVRLLGAVLGRVCAAAAVQAHFSVDRHSDLDLVADELAALTGKAAGSAGIGFSVAAGERRLELRVGPFPAGARDRLQELAGEPGGVPGAEPVPLQLLTDELTVASVDGVALLELHVRDDRRR